MNYEKRKELIAKPLWSLIDIKNYFELGTNKASAVRQVAVLKFKGGSALYGRLVKIDAIFKAMNLNLSDEIKKLREEI